MAFYFWDLLRLLQGWCISVHLHVFWMLQDLRYWSLSMTLVSLYDVGLSMTLVSLYDIGLSPWHWSLSMTLVSLWHWSLYDIGLSLWHWSLSMTLVSLYDIGLSLTLVSLYDIGLSMTVVSMTFARYEVECSILNDWLHLCIVLLYLLLEWAINYNYVHVKHYLCDLIDW